MASFSERLKELRIEKRLTQEELATIFFLVLWVSDIIQYYTTLYNDINYLYRFIYIVPDVTNSYKFVLNLSGQKKKE